jgi:hypothetical protein
MSRIDLNSTSLTAAAYLEGQTVLELEFRSGAVYLYLGVPAETYGGLLQAQSKGAYFNHYIRNRYSYVKIHAEQPTRSCDSEAIGLVRK